MFYNFLQLVRHFITVLACLQLISDKFRYHIKFHASKGKERSRRDYLTLSGEHLRFRRIGSVWVLRKILKILKILGICRTRIHSRSDCVCSMEQTFRKFHSPHQGVYINRTHRPMRQPSNQRNSDRRYRTNPSAHSVGFISRRGPSYIPSVQDLYVPPSPVVWTFGFFATSIVF